MKRFSWKILFLCALLLPTFPSLAFADFFIAQQAYAKGNWRVAYDEFLPMAIEGNPIAQFYIGRIYDSTNLDRIGVTYKNGDQIIQNPKTALRWYLKAAKQGHVQGQRQAGIFFKYGQLYRDAFKWLKRASEAGDPEAQFQLGIMYHYGMGMPRDDAKAAKWLGLGGPNMSEYKQKQYGWKAGQGFGAPAQGKDLVNRLKDGGSNDSDAIRANRVQSRGTVSHRSEANGEDRSEEYEKTVGSFF